MTVMIHCANKSLSGPLNHAPNQAFNRRNVLILGPKLFLICKKKKIVLDMPPRHFWHDQKKCLLVCLKWARTSNFLWYLLLFHWVGDLAHVDSNVVILPNMWGGYRTCKFQLSTEILVISGKPLKWRCQAASLLMSLWLVWIHCSSHAGREWWSRGRIVLFCWSTARERWLQRFNLSNQPLLLPQLLRPLQLRGSRKREEKRRI